MWGCIMKNIYRFLLGRFLDPVQQTAEIQRNMEERSFFMAETTIKYSNSSIYTEQFFQGSKNGNGHYISSEGYEYVGDWIGGKQTGKAQVNYKNGDLYTGKVKDGLRHGKGELFQVSQN